MSGEESGGQWHSGAGPRLFCVRLAHLATHQIHVRLTFGRKFDFLLNFSRLECYEYLFELACEMIRFGVPLVPGEPPITASDCARNGSSRNGK